jgi:hypothetical protein
VLGIKLAWRLDMWVPGLARSNKIRMVIFRSPALIQGPFFLAPFG